MRILVVHNNLNPDHEKHSAVDSWRLTRPIAELRKHCPDWEIVEQGTVIPNFEKYKDMSEFTEEEMEAAFKDICSYDIIFSSYQANPTIYTLLKVAQDRAGVQHIMDVDDDMFAINPDNPIWTKMTDEKIYFMQRMVADVTWLSTTNSFLADRFRERRINKDPASVFVNPNAISDAYKHPGFDNGEKIVIGYFGGSTHYKDIHDTGFLPALRRVMHEHKKVHFRSVGMIVDEYLPKGRYTVEDGKKGDGWLNEVYPSLNFDIAVAPLTDNIFNRGKSNIKWQESTRMGSAVIASDIGPYSSLPSKAVTLIRNTEEDWYTALKQLVEDETKRKEQVKVAQKALENYRLEKKWTQYVEMFEKVYAESKRQRNSVGKPKIVLA